MTTGVERLPARDPAGVDDDVVAQLDRARLSGDLHQIGQLSYLVAQARARQARHVEALAHVADAREAFEAGDHHVDALRVGLGRMHVLNELGRHDEAVETGRDLRATLQEGMLPEEDVAWLRGAADKNLGVSHGLLGHHAEALTAYRSARAQFQALGLSDEVAPLLHNEATELLELGRSRDALAGFASAAERLDQTGQQAEAAVSRRDGAAALLHLGRFEEARGILTDTRAAFVALDMAGEVARCDRAMGEVLLVLGRLPEAADTLTRAADALRAAGMQHDLSEALLYLGQTMVRMGQRSVAREVLAEAATLADACGATHVWALAMLERPSPDGDDDDSQTLEQSLSSLDALDWPVEAAKIRLRAVHHALKRGQLPVATRHLAVATRLVGTIDRSRLRTQLGFARGALALAAGDGTGASEILSDVARHVESHSHDLESHLDRLHFLDDQVDVMDVLVSADLAAGRIDSAHDHLERRKAWVLQTQLTANGVASEAITPDHSSVGPTETTVVCWQVTATGMVGLVRNGGETRAVNLGSPAELQTLVRRLAAQWARQRMGAAIVGRHADQLRRTTDSLLDQLRSMVIDPLEIPSGDRLILSPDGCLHDVPFAALGGRERPLVADHVISVVPSALLGRHAHVGLRAQDRVTLVAPHDDLLAGAAAEVQRLADLLPDATVVTGDVTADRMAHAMAASDLVHIACHGRFREDAPFASEIQLSDGWITASTVASWSAAGSIVVLSACGVGRSAPLGGERVGMARALLGAGARAVLLAKWDIPDVDTARLLPDVYVGLKDGLSLPEALQAAQQQRADHHPYRWAAFEVMHR